MAMAARPYLQERTLIQAGRKVPIISKKSELEKKHKIEASYRKEWLGTIGFARMENLGIRKSKKELGRSKLTWDTGYVMRGLA
jgi:hypothetical protein